jgi:hypothetical protein
LDEAEFFLPVFLQELIYMGDKVFGRKRDQSVSGEVDGALEFLEVYGARKRGEKTDRPFYSGEACKFAIMIVGLFMNVDEERYEVYLKHIVERLVPSGVETIYMVGPARNAPFMGEVAKRATRNFARPLSRDYEVTILNRDGQPVRAVNHLCVLRKTHLVRYVPQRF